MPCGIGILPVRIQENSTSTIQSKASGDPFTQRKTQKKIQKKQREIIRLSHHDREIFTSLPPRGSPKLTKGKHPKDKNIKVSGKI